MRAVHETVQLTSGRDRPMSFRFYARHFLPEDASRRSRRGIFRSSEPPASAEFDEIADSPEQVDVGEGDIASEKDFKDRMRYQAERYMELQASGSKEFTPQWRAWGEKHADEIARLARSQR